MNGRLDTYGYDLQDLLVDKYIVENSRTSNSTSFPVKKLIAGTFF